mmetsp:Transcript_45625/g.82383  ORF Transcript_45625/g.82383 Transcript_45625/m.82383 type:complete len:128 (-) Transcript_45625:135-518(-)
MSLPPVDKAALDKEAKAMSAEMDEQTTKTREYLDSFFSQPLRDGMMELAVERPHDARALLGQVWTGKKSLGEISKAPKTVDPVMRSAGVRDYLNLAVGAELKAGLVHALREQSRRPVSDVGELLANK